MQMYKKLPLPKKLKKAIIWFGNQRFLVGVIGVIVNEHNKVLLLKHTYRTRPWGMPGGWLNAEEPQQGIIREIFEETKLIVKINRIIKTEYADNPSSINIYFGGYISDGKFSRSEEISDYGFFGVNEFPEDLPYDQRTFLTEYLEQYKADS